MSFGKIWRTFRREFTIDRGPFFLSGLILGGIKYGLDNQIAAHLFGRFWSPWDYVISGATLSQLAQARDDRTFFLTLLAESIPFIAIGIALTLARLRSAGASYLLVFLFFLPVFNIVLFIILSILKPKAAAQPIAPPAGAADQAPLPAISSPPGDIVLDPFGGSGTTLVTAKKLDRRFVGFELSTNYAEQIQKRLAATKPGDALSCADANAITAPPTPAEPRKRVHRKKVGKKMDNVLMPFS